MHFIGIYHFPACRLFSILLVLVDVICVLVALALYSKEDNVEPLVSVVNSEDFLIQNSAIVKTYSASYLGFVGLDNMRTVRKQRT